MMIISVAIGLKYKCGETGDWENTLENIAVIRAQDDIFMN